MIKHRLEVQTLRTTISAMYAITALRQSRYPTVAKTAARSNSKRDLLCGPLLRKRFKTCSEQGLKMKNKRKEPCVQIPHRRRTHGSFHINWTYAAT